ncbi:MAG: STAS domain-containing protein [Verrucomicrobia bacterium]|nr:STAS domain-containing protein [Verrucomicrobiota bacterium]
MSLQLDCDPGLLRFSGRLDANGARLLDAWLSRASALPSVWDFSKLEFLSSAGIRSLLLLDRRVRTSGRRIQIAITSPLIADTLSHAGLDSLWDTHPNIASALAAASSDPAREVQEAMKGVSGHVYRITPARASGTVAHFRAAIGGRPLLLRYDELGIAIGRGGFDTVPGEGKATPGQLFATGQTALVRTADGVTDYLSTLSPQRTFAWVEEAVRLETDTGERWDTEGPIRWESLRTDLDHRAAAAGSTTWAAGIACEWAGRQTALGVFTNGGTSLVLAVRAEGPPPDGGHATLAEAATAVATAPSPEVAVPDAAAEFSRVRVWFLPAPTIRNGSDQRLIIEINETLPDSWERIIRSIFTEEARVRLQRLTGGYMASTFAADTVDRLGRRTLPTVLKISSRGVTAREEAAHRQFVRPFILNNATVLFGQAAHGEYAGLRYNFVGITGSESRLQTLESLYLSEGFPAAVTAIRQTFTNVLDPWYGQAVVSEVRPFVCHDPRTLFPTLPEAAMEFLGIHPGEPRLVCPLLGPHGDLNLNNILVDERRNIYVIDFSETRIRNIVSDFARLEPMGLLQFTRLASPADSVVILRVVEASLRGPIWKMPAAPPEAVDPLLLRAITLATELRALAAQRVAEPSHEAAYLMPLLEWTMPIVAFRQLERERKQLAAWSAGLILERLLQVMGLPESN